MRTTPGQGLFPTILLHFHPPWRSEGGGTTAGMQELGQRMEHDYTDVGVRVAPGAATELPDVRERPCTAVRSRRACAITSPRSSADTVLVSYDEDPLRVVSEQLLAEAQPSPIDLSNTRRIVAPSGCGAAIPTRIA